MTGYAAPLARSTPDELPTVPWTLLLTPLTVIGYCAGLGLVAVTVAYDLAHWNAVAALYPGEIAGSMPPHARAHAWFDVVFIGAVVVAAVGLTVPALLGRNVARLGLAVVCNPLFLCVVGAAAEAIGGPSVAGGGHDETFPLWLGMAALLGVLMIVVFGFATTVLVLLRPTGRYVEARRGL